MAIANFEQKEISCKVVYFGPKNAGKTANLQSICRATSKEIKANRFDFNNPGPTKYFEFLPLSIGYVRDYHIKLHIYSYVENYFMQSVSQTLLTGLDGYVCVFDSQIEAFSSNVLALEETMRLLGDAGYNLGELPCVMQYNKMDLEHLVPPKILKEELNPTGGYDCFSVATNSEGPLSTLKIITSEILKQIGPARDVNKSVGHASVV